MPAIINLLIMCAGINSRGTLKEVLRGYLGDKNANRLFDFDEDINLGPFSLLRGEMFDIFSQKNNLRPFELATKRLMNMIETKAQQLMAKAKNLDAQQQTTRRLSTRRFITDRRS